MTAASLTECDVAHCHAKYRERLTVCVCVCVCVAAALLFISRNIDGHVTRATKAVDVAPKRQSVVCFFRGCICRGVTQPSGAPVNNYSITPNKH